MSRSASSSANSLLSLRWMLPLGLPLAVIALSTQVAAQSANTDQAYRARTEVRFSEIETQLRSLTGRMEELDYSIRRLGDKVERLAGDLDFRLSELERGAQPPASAQGGVPTAENGAVASNTTESNAPNTVGEQTAAVPTTAPDAPQVLPDGSALEQYSFAQQLVLQSRFDEAEAALKDFISRHPEHRLAHNARYWLGETYYVRRRYQPAAAEFLNAWQKAPKGSKAPDNLLKLSLSLSALDKKREACVTLGKLLSDYPTIKSAIRTRAEQERGSLGCS